MVRRVGAHVSIGGGLLKAVDRAAERGCDAVQTFPSNPRGWALPSVNEDEEADLRAALEERGWPLFLHAPYLVNLASPDRETWERSAATLDFALGRGTRLGAAAVIVHAGHARGTDRDDALDRAAAALRVLLDRHPDCALAIEPTAGATGAIAGTPAQMLEVLDAVDHHPNLRFCLDTCHLWAAGVRYSDPDVLRATRAAVQAIGPERMAAVHLNDSRDPCGSHRDRHANLGDGEIGLAAIEALVTAPELAAAPLLLETPGGVERQRDEVALARSWTGAAS